MDAGLAFLPATEQAELIRSRELSPVELTETYLERIESLDPSLGAYVTVCADEALAAARAAEAVPPDRPFRGVPLAVKDLAETAGVRTTFSCRAFADYVPERDVAVVRRLREAGFVVLGKTNTPEFGTLPVTESTLNGVCRSPWDTSRGAGGSSGGAAAALAAGLCAAAHGSDGGGSIRIPAACCGVVGLKPSRGRVSHAPYTGVAGLATHGPITRTVRDAAALLDVIAGYETGDPYWAPPPARPFSSEVEAAPGRLRIAVTTSPPFDATVDPACVRAALDTSALLTELGHEVQEATPRWTTEEALFLFARVWSVGPALYPVRDPELLDSVNRGLAEAAYATNSVEYTLADLRLKQFAREVVAFWDDYDVVVTPTLAQRGIDVGWPFDDDLWRQFERAASFTPFTAIANVTGQPAVSLPVAWEDGLPVGVQLIGRPADEATVIRLSAQLEDARPWAERRPPIAEPALYASTPGGLGIQPGRRGESFGSGAGRP